MTIPKLFRKNRQSSIQKQLDVNINRLQELKLLKALANTYLKFYLERQKLNEEGWENDLSNRNISLLKATISKMNKLQHDNKIKEYLQAIRHRPHISLDATNEEREKAFNDYAKNFSIAFSQGSNLIFLMKINRCSPRLSYFNDLTWFKHGTIKEHLDYGMGKVDETVFEKYLPYQIDRFAKTKQTLFSTEYFKEDKILLNTSLQLIAEEKLIPANILIITLIEGLVRKFAFLVYKKQNPNISDSDADAFAYIRNRSLELLIKNGKWKRDIPVLFSHFINEYAHVDNQTVFDFEEKLIKHKEANVRIKRKVSKFHDLLSQHIKNPTLSDEELRTIGLKHIDELTEESNCLMKEEEKTVMIGVDVYLNYLATKFTQDRNNIIHGKYSFFKERWKTLVYLTALQTLTEKILWYEKNVSF